MQQCDSIYRRSGEGVLKPPLVEVQARAWDVEQIHHFPNEGY